ncbi:hypothetical protein ACGFYU_22120 [Streptomyces sp. NPDC048337]|uniref:D-alanyl-D-alanine carboxypeptidase n=1 Tax=Streptomyces sp. NPDC048337 TaxID=3365535 RepID=UPI0037112D6E
MADADAEAGVGADAGKRDPLRDAVAAWVATADGSDADSEAERDAEPGGATTVFKAVPDPAGSSGRVDSAAEPESSDSAAAVEPSKPAGGERTTSFRAAKASASVSDAPAAQAKPAASASQPADSERTAVFRAVKESASAPGEAARAKPDASAGESQDSERTAVFRVAKPASAAEAASGAAAPVDAGKTKPAATAGESAESERTAVFRAVKESASAPAEAARAKPDASAGESQDSERTAVFRVAKPGSEAAGAKPEAADSEQTAVFRAVKPGSGSAVAGDGAAPVQPPKADSGSAEVESAGKPKASTFVPLRTDEPGERQPKPPAPAPAPARAAATSTSAERNERTTQQPLPPKPPLDMLADLTNNPPPPPSPMRTAIRRFKIYFPLAVLLAIILAVVQLVRPLPQPQLVMSAKSSYTFEGSKPELPWPSEGQAYMAAAGLGTLGQSGEQKPVPIASVTKSMTAYIILRDHPIKKGEKGAMIDVDKTAETEGKKNNSTDNESTLDTVKEGDKISEYDAIAALMIPSANNIARLLARWDSGSQEAFVKKMNDTAKELGMTNTTYTDPSGLDATTVSTAEDQVKLGLKLVEIETLLDITKKPNWTDPSGKTWRNWNGLVPFNDSLGIKTGTTTKAGGNLLFAAKKTIGNTNQLIVGAVLGQHKPPIIDSVLAASKQLLIATQKSLEGAPVVKKGDVVGYVDDGLGGRTPVVATADVQAIGWATLTVNVKLADGGSKLPQTAKAGTEIGMLTVGEGASQVKVPVALQSDLVAPGIGSKLTRVG